jgi:hypothetical protein
MQLQFPGRSSLGDSGKPWSNSGKRMSARDPSSPSRSRARGVRRSRLGDKSRLGAARMFKGGPHAHFLCRFGGGAHCLAVERPTREQISALQHNCSVVSSSPDPSQPSGAEILNSSRHKSLRMESPSIVALCLRAEWPEACLHPIPPQGLRDRSQQSPHMGAASWSCGCANPDRFSNFTGHLDGPARPLIWPREERGGMLRR